MIVLFDIWLRDNGKVIYTQQQEAMFEAIFNYIYDRVHLFIDQIDKEEEDKSTPRAIMVYLLVKPYSMQPRGYSEILHNKIVGSFNEKDVELLWESVAKAVSTFMN